jgi:hypothetical protein
MAKQKSDYHLAIFVFQHIAISFQRLIFSKNYLQTLLRLVGYERNQNK